MNTIRALTALLTAFLGLAASSASRAQSPDLRVIQAEYDNQLLDRVTAVHNAALAKLDAIYLAGLDRSFAEATTAGDLEGALSLQAEKKRVADREALPANDDKATNALKKLRAIYRAELAKLDAQRIANQAAILPPHIAKLKQLEVELTKAARLADAKAVMDYRQGLAAGVPQNSTPSGSATKNTPSDTTTENIPAGSLVIEALIDGTSELRVKKSGLYWINISDSKPGRHSGSREATYINGKPWQPNWKNTKSDKGPDTSSTHILPASVDVSKLELKILSVGAKRGEEGIGKHDALQTKEVKEELSILIHDGQGGSRWYKFALVPRKG